MSNETGYDFGDEPGVPRGEGRTIEECADRVRDEYEWELGLSAVLYNARDDAPEPRELWHVTGRYRDVDGRDHIYRLEDGTHTYEQYYHHDDVLVDFEPAGWTWPHTEKPLYYLTRECGLYDPMDVMTREVNRP